MSKREKIVIGELLFVIQKKVFLNRIEKQNTTMRLNRQEPKKYVAIISEDMQEMSGSSRSLTIEARALKGLNLSKVSRI